jgi:hypothetical protein
MRQADIFFSVKSMMDDFGRVFFRDGRIFRAINPDKKQYCLDLINSELFKELIEKKYIPETNIADFSLDNYDLILENELLTETLQHEWSLSMLKDASLLVLNVNETCNKYGYELKDAHTLNVLFKGTNPVWVDIGSILPINKEIKNWEAFFEFVGSFVIPLLFWSENNFYITRKLLESNFYRVDLLPSAKILDNELISLLKRGPVEYHLNFGDMKIKITSNEDKKIKSYVTRFNKLLKFLTFGNKRDMLKYEAQFISIQGIRKLITESPAPKIASEWQDYHQHYYSGDGTLKSSDRFEKIVEIVHEISGEIKSAIDLAGNQGLLCMMLAEKTNLKKIILSDYDSNAIEGAFIKLKEKRIENIVPILLNFMFTSDIKGTAARLKSDLALALAVTHHLILSNRFSIESIFERIKSYSNKYVMIEFMPLGLWVYGSSNYPHLPSWYTEEWFKINFEKYFTLIKKQKLEENRVLFFGRRDS